MSELKLKHCPFCGAEVHLENNDGDYLVACEQCMIAVIPPGEEPGATATKEEAIAAWNRRADGWIPIKTRPLTEEEKEGHPDWSYILDCELPDDGQRILIHCVYNKHESVQLDQYYDDCGMCYLDSGYDLGEEVDAWMPLPEPPEVNT